jgi:hypothetical protein
MIHGGAQVRGSARSIFSIEKRISYVRRTFQFFCISMFSIFHVSFLAKYLYQIFLVHNPLWLDYTPLMRVHDLSFLAYYTKKRL